MDRRELPSVDRLLRVPEVAALPREGAVAAVRETLARAREEIAAGHDPGDLVQRVVDAAEGRQRPRLRHVVNATGVVLHTNLGRAPIAAAALEHVRLTARAYSNLEYDLADGRRGSRHDHLAAILRQLTRASSALVSCRRIAARWSWREPRRPSARSYSRLE